MKMNKKSQSEEIAADILSKLGRKNLCLPENLTEKNKIEVLHCILTHKKRMFKRLDGCNILVDFEERMVADIITFLFDEKNFTELDFIEILNKEKGTYLCNMNKLTKQINQ